MVAVQNQFYNIFSLNEAANTSKVTLVAEVKTFHIDTIPFYAFQLTGNYQA